jgi:transcriptional antiterminator RfaH
MSQSPNEALPLSTVGWAVLMSHPHKESYAASHLRRQDFVVYLPQIIKRISHARKIQELHRPLFPGYLFAQVDWQTARWRAMESTFGIRNVIRAGARPLLLPDSFIEELRARETNGVVMRPPTPFARGATVRVVSGAFSGTVSKILEVDDRDRVMILLKILARDVAAPFDASSVVKVDESDLRSLSPKAPPPRA